MSNTKPQMKCELSVSCVMKDIHAIYFFASADALNDVSEFGTVGVFVGRQYVLNVDSRYDFDEVVNYMQNYG